MSETKNQQFIAGQNTDFGLPRHQDYTIPDPSLDVMQGTLGRRVVQAEQDATAHTLAADLYGRQLDAALHLEQKVQPEGGRIRYQLGRLAGKSIGREEKEWLKGYSSTDSTAWKDKEEIGRGISEKRKISGLEEVRRRFSKLTENEKWKMNLYLTDNVPKFLGEQMLLSGSKRIKEAIGEDLHGPLPDTSWSHWLGAEASNEQLTNFLQWHVHSLAEQEINPEFQAEVEKQREAYKTALRNGIDDSWLSPDAQYAIEKVDDIQVCIGDMFDTLISGTLGYHITGEEYVVIAQGIGKDATSRLASLIANIKDGLMHEWNHAVLGEFGEEWLNEALTEHIARTLQYGLPEAVNPAYRGNDPDEGGYIARRELLDAILNFGSRRVSVFGATRLYSSTQTQEPDTKFWDFEAPLSVQLDESWGIVGLLHDVSNHISNLQEKHIKAGMSHMQAQKAAAVEARSDLLQQPEVIFYPEYERPAMVAIS